MQYQKLGEAPPVSQEMARVLDASPAISVQQTMRGCLQECMGCEAKSEYKVYYGHVEQGQPRAEGIPPMGHLLEESPFILRCCCSASRPFTMPFTVPDADGRKVLEFKKGWNLPICCVIPVPDKEPLNCPCCCFLPEMETYAVADGSTGSLAGSAACASLCPKFSAPARGSR